VDTTLLQSLMANVGRPDVDTVRNLSAAILVDQKRATAGIPSCVAKGVTRSIRNREAPVPSRF
jgi:excinuclease UvrABC ATPase subunit